MSENRFKLFRKALGIELEELANDIKVKPRTIYSYEGGNSNPNLEILNLLAEKHNLNIHWYVTGNGSMFNKPKNTFEIKYEPITINQFDFGKRLNKVRVQADMISAELSMLLDIKENRLLDIMNGKNEPTLEEVKKICENFNVTADWLIPLGVFFKRVVKSHSFCMFEVYLKFIHYCPWDIYGTFLKFLCITL